MGKNFPCREGSMVTDERVKCICLRHCCRVTCEIVESGSYEMYKWKIQNRSDGAPGGYG